MISWWSPTLLWSFARYVWEFCSIEILGSHLQHWVRGWERMRGKERERENDMGKRSANRYSWKLQRLWSPSCAGWADWQHILMPPTVHTLHALLMDKLYTEATFQQCLTNSLSISQQFSVQFMLVNMIRNTCIRYMVCKPKYFGTLSIMF